MMLAPTRSPFARSTKYRPNTWHARNTDLTLTVMIWSYSSSGISRNGRAELIPAPLIRMSTPPVLPHDLREQRLEAFLVRCVAGLKGSRSAGRCDPLDAVPPLFRVSIGHDDVGACCGQPFGHRATELPGAPHHDGHFACELE